MIILICVPTVIPILAIVILNNLILVLIIKSIVNDGLEENCRNAVIIVLRNESDAGKSSLDNTENLVDSCVESALYTVNFLIEFILRSEYLSCDFLVDYTTICKSSFDSLIELCCEGIVEISCVELVSIESAVHLLKHLNLSLESTLISIYAESFLEGSDVSESSGCICLGVISSLLGISYLLNKAFVLLVTIEDFLYGSKTLRKFSELFIRSFEFLLGSECCINIIFGSKSLDCSLNAADLGVDVADRSLERRNRSVNLLDLSIELIGQSLDLVLNGSLQRSISCLVSLLKILDVSIVLCLQGSQRLLERLYC